MSNNTYKNQRRQSIFSFIEKLLQKTSISESLPLKYLPHILLVFVLGITYVANTHYHQKILRKISSIENEISELRVSYTTLKANFMFNSKQSEISKKVVDIDLYESKIPPFLVK